MCPCARHEGVWGRRCVAPFILDPGSSSRYTAVESTSGDPGTLSGPQDWSKQNGQKNLLPLLGIITRTVQPSSGVLRGGWGFKPPPRNSEGPPKSCQTQPDCENCQKLLNLGCQHTKMFGKKAVKFQNYLGSQLF